MTTVSNDEWAPRPPKPDSEPDAHGQAALLLAESILHALIESQALTLDQAVEAVNTACSVKAEVAAELGESEHRMRQSLGLLAKIERSLMTHKNELGASQ